MLVFQTMSETYGWDGVLGMGSSWNGVLDWALVDVLGGWNNLLLNVLVLWLLDVLVLNLKGIYPNPLVLLKYSMDLLRNFSIKLKKNTRFYG
jgi:hypothetical protein